MPRIPRLLLSLSYYHVIARGNNKNIVFKKHNDYLKYLDLISKYKKDHPFDLYHYCLMPNHIHLLIKTNKATDFSTFMKRLSLSYFYYYKYNYGWSGHFWQDRFRSQPVGKDEYFIQCGKYIELNPVRAKMVNDPNDYTFSSYRYYSQGTRNNLITKDFFYDSIDDSNKEKAKKYQQLVIGEIAKLSYGKPVWGSSQQQYNESKKINYHKK